MDIDDPQLPEFASHESFREFERQVQHGRRYIFDRGVQAFLDTVLATSGGRDRKIPEGYVLNRAQLGVCYAQNIGPDGFDYGPTPVAFGAKRMKPFDDRAKEGRVNPAGMPALYLATKEQTAISEVRPWVGSEVSVAQFRVVRDLKAVDLSIGHGQFSVGHLTMDQIIGYDPVPAHEKAKVVWIDIDNAFSRPVTRSDDTADYVPTQILAELFRSAGYDGVVYRSMFGEEGYNVALFDMDLAIFVSCTAYEVTGLQVSFREMPS